MNMFIPAIITFRRLKAGDAAPKRPVMIDVEKAVAVMLADSDIKDESLRQKFQLIIIKTFPSQSIDWETVDWVHIWPFQTHRL